MPTNPVNMEVHELSFDNGITYLQINDMNEAQLTVDGTLVEYTTLEAGGFSNAVKTGIKITASFTGQRNVVRGTTPNCQAKIEDMALKVGKASEAEYRVTFPDGAILECPVVVNCKTIGGGASTALSAFGFDLNFKGKPDFTPGTV